MKKRIKVVLIVIFVIVLLGIIFGAIDYYRVTSGKRPMFSIYNTALKDGGSVEYFGIGYKILKCNTISDDNSIKIGFYNLKYSCNGISSGKEDMDYKGLCANDVIKQVKSTEDEYYSNNEKIRFPFTINIQEKSNCANSKKIYYEDTSTYTSIYLICLDDVIINFNDKTISLEEALKTNKITIDDIADYIPFKEHVYYSVSRYIYSGEYGLSNKGFAIYKCNAFNTYYIGPLSMCSDETYCNFLTE